MDKAAILCATELGPRNGHETHQISKRTGGFVVSRPMAMGFRGHLAPLQPSKARV